VRHSKSKAECQSRACLRCSVDVEGMVQKIASIEQVAIRSVLRAWGRKQIVEVGATATFFTHEVVNIDETARDVGLQ
jgi:hypothetical protein